MQGLARKEIKPTLQTLMFAHSMFPDDDIFTQAALQTMDRSDISSFSPTDVDFHVKLKKEASINDLTFS